MRSVTITVEEEREGKERATDIISTSLYACKLLDSKGVAILRKTIATTPTTPSNP